ncbi:MAG: N-acetylneuraminate synthase family protein, partial [Phycisphaerae bacterium]
FDHAVSAKRVDAVLLTTDSAPAKGLARGRGIAVVDRPAELATDAATVDDAARHAVRQYEASGRGQVDLVVMLYGNIPVRAIGLIDRAVDKLVQTGADSVRSVAAVTKQHPDWVHRLSGDRMDQFRANSIYRRQDLEPLYYHDGAVAVVTRNALLAAPRWVGDFQGFLGEDRRAIICQPEDCVDIDGPVDLYLAEAVLRSQRDRQRQKAGAVTIGVRTIGVNQPVYVIAEAGVNHNGSLEQAVALVDAAVGAGADAVKFQMFSAEALVTRTAPTASYQRANAGDVNQYEMLKRLELGAEAFSAVQKRCRERAIEFLATPFSTDDVGTLLEMGVAALKFASTDIINFPLLRAGAKTGLPLICSTGAATSREIGRAVGELTRWGAAERTVLLHCVSSYPTPTDQANLRAIATLADRFGLPVGYSDHTESQETGALAVAGGAVVIEKHFTLDRSGPGPDHAMSLEPKALADYIQQIRRAESFLGAGSLDVADCEAEVRRLARRSVVAGRDIAAGERLDASALCLKRPGGGLQPAELDQLIGRRSRADIPAQTPITWEMVE